MKGKWTGDGKVKGSNLMIIQVGRDQYGKSNESPKHKWSNG